MVNSTSGVVDRGVLGARSNKVMGEPMVQSSALTIGSFFFPTSFDVVCL